MIEFQPSRDAATVYAVLMSCGKAMYERARLRTWLHLQQERVEEKVADGIVWEAREKVLSRARLLRLPGG